MLLEFLNFLLLFDDGTDCSFFEDLKGFHELGFLCLKFLEESHLYLLFLNQVERGLGYGGEAEETFQLMLVLCRH